MQYLAANAKIIMVTHRVVFQNEERWDGMGVREKSAVFRSEARKKTVICEVLIGWEGLEWKSGGVA